jgi:UbiD family decarboxylase
MPQTSLAEYVQALDKAGLLTRIKEEKRVDELPALMEANPDTAVFVEKVKDCAFPFFANGYGVRPMYALALDCDFKKVGLEIARRSALRQKPQLVSTAPCKDVILKGNDIDLTIFPLFHHHPGDGQAYLNDTNVVSRDPDTGLIDQGIYRFMYRSKNETNIDMRNDTHGALIHALRNQQLGKDMPIAVVIGQPALDTIASMVSFPGVDDWDILGGFYGEPAKLVKCETNDLTVPANAELVIEGRVITTEGWIHDEGPYGEYTGTYGGGLPHNNRFVVDCITHRKGMIYKHATIGGLHPGRTDMYCLPTHNRGRSLSCPPARGNPRPERLPAVRGLFEYRLREHQDSWRGRRETGVGSDAGRFAAVDAKSRLCFRRGRRHLQRRTREVGPSVALQP